MRFKGLGTEDMGKYKNCKLIYLNIGNIHKVKDSWKKMKKLCE